MSVLQIILISLSGLCSVLSIIFMIMFMVELYSNKSSDGVKNIYNSSYEDDSSAKSVDDMIAALEKEATEPEVETVEDNQSSEIVEANESVESNEEAEAVKDNEVAEPAVSAEPEIIELFEEKEEKESQDEIIAESEQDEIEDVEENPIESFVEDIEVPNNNSTEKIEQGTVIDYKARLETIIANRNKIDKDLAKLQKSILKYERTERRKNRNQKMLDRRAGELTNLNLLMYSVTDIKNVDEEKKIKQEELTAHIAELKASIQDADEYITSNKEKNEQNIKMAKFLTKERARYNDEIAELKALIEKAENDVA